MSSVADTSTDLPTWVLPVVIIVPIVTLIIGGLLGFYIATKVFKKQMRENPPITADQIRAMYAQMGRKPSEQQIQQIMNMMKNQGKK
ncbi:MAG: YneF family protein [Mycoplasmataceae bacterium]|jgi:uncharacterized protein YneF (UPF0154 family)|nr:YneF family protein [Mycoplasmataceae bacterium]